MRLFAQSKRRDREGHAVFVVTLWLSVESVIKSLAEFRTECGINFNLKKVATQGELPKGQERVAWAMRVTFFTSQPGKCRSVKQMCR